MAIDTLFGNLYALAVARAPRPLAPLLRPRVLLKQRTKSVASQKERRRTVSRNERDVTSSHFSWYRGEHANFGPTKINLSERDALEKYFLQGWVPEHKFISKQTPVVAFGSCFAAHISRYLTERGFNILGDDLRREAYIVRFGEGMVNSFAIRQQFEWAFEGRAFKEGLWHDKSGQLLRPEESVREQTLSMFHEAEVFVLTLGLSEVWYDKLSGDVFWRAIPSDAFDSKQHGFRVSTVAENLDNLRTIVHLIRKYRPGARIVITLSPVPLVATFRPVSCVSANSVSKAVLRVAVDELMREQPDTGVLHYFPSYEIVTAYFRDAYTLDNRHVHPRVVRKIMETFVRHYVPDHGG